MPWDTFKEIFYTVGAIAGLLALSKPAFEAKFNRDAERAKYVLDLITEEKLINLEHHIWQQRAVPDSTFNALLQLQCDLDDNTEKIRFSGPIARHLRTEAQAMVEAYKSVRQLVQVNEWEPTDRDDETYWVFNKSAFNDEHGVPRNYDKHLDECADRARVVLKHYQRFQITAELHFIEFPVAKWLLKRRFKLNNVA